MKITVITVCFNAAATIERTIRSVLWQDYPNIEYIIVDGMSTDGTMSLVNKYRDAISTVVREPDDGIYDAMNKGILRSTGDIINFMNANDYFLSPDVLSQIAEAFNKHPEVQFVYGDCVKDKGKTQIFKRHPDLIRKRSFSRSFNHQTMFYRRSAFDIVGLFNTHYKIYADYDWIARAILVHKLSHFHIPLLICVFESGGVSGRYSHIRKAERRVIQENYFSCGECLYLSLSRSIRGKVKRLVNGLGLPSGNA